MSLLNRSGNEGEAASIKEPVIRERYFGLGTRRKPVERPRPQAKSLWAKLGLGKDNAVAEEPFKPTEIHGTPVAPTPVAPTPVAPKPVEAKPLENKPAEEQPRASAEVPQTLPLRAQNDEQILKSLFGEPAAAPKAAEPPPVKAVARPAPTKPPKKRKKLDRGDLTLAALGITLGFTCAIFPWYIFFNQEKFGVREFVFEGGRGMTPPTSVAYQPQMVGQPFSSNEVPKMDLDFFPTATLPSEDEQARAVPASEQPFPLDLVDYRLVHVANGRAMIEDADGLWVVQPGSRLPDASRVVTIEQRSGSWVLVTSLDKIIELKR